MFQKVANKDSFWGIVCKDGKNKKKLGFKLSDQ